jgi:glycosyltransferase involved in cell wall biosynthesis
MDSVAQQQGPTVQHVIVDDGSSDDSLAVIRANGSPQVKCRDKPNGGLSHTLNACVAIADGEWLGWLNADDYYLPGALRTVADVIDRNPDADFVFGDSVYVDEFGKLMALHAQHRLYPSVLRWMSTHIAPCAMFFRKSALPAGVFDEELLLLMDWDICLAYLQQNSKFVYLPTPLGAFRRHEKQASRPASAIEHQRVRQRYRMPRTARTMAIAREVGKYEHRLHKVAAGAYLRELRVRRWAGMDTRWFADPETAKATSAMLAAGSSRALARG